MATPAVTAWDLHKAWPGGIPHRRRRGTFDEPGILDRLIDRATDRFARN